MSKRINCEERETRGSILNPINDYHQFSMDKKEENFICDNCDEKRPIENPNDFFKIIRKGIFYYHQDVLINDWMNTYLENHSTKEEWDKSEELLNNDTHNFWMEIAEKAARKYYKQYLENDLDLMFGK